MTINLPYRPGVGIMLLNDWAKVFVAKRIDMTSEAWLMQKGGIDAGETPEQAAIRELEEETGVTDASIVAELPDWFDYDLPEHLVPKLGSGRFRGQTQKWFAMKLNGPDDQINIETEHPEFSEWKWVDIGEIPDLIVPFKRDMYQRLVDEVRSVIGIN